MVAGPQTRRHRSLGLDHNDDPSQHWRALLAGYPRISLRREELVAQERRHQERRNRERRGTAQALVALLAARNQSKQNASPADEFNVRWAIKLDLTPALSITSLMQLILPIFS